MFLSLTLLSLCLTAAPEEPAPAAGVYALRYHLVGDGVSTGALLGAWLSTETVFKKSLAPENCRWCDRAPDGTDTLNAVDAWGRGVRGSPDQLLAFDTASGVVAFGVLSVAVLGTDAALAWSNGALEGLPVDALIIAQSVALALTLNQVVKFTAGRERPFVHALPEDEKALTERPSDNNLSFFSGHSTFAFTMAVATGTVASLRGYKHAWVVWAIGLPIAAMAPLLRMQADRHYLTDVVTGAALGAAVGYAVPTLLHGRVDEAARRGVSFQVVPGPGGLALAGVF
ncbi:MAG: phosphatase PAP2 family protein [Myxococcaceae bacterium]